MDICYIFTGDFQLEIRTRLLQDSLRADSTVIAEEREGKESSMQGALFFFRSSALTVESARCNIDLVVSIIVRFICSERRDKER